MSEPASERGLCRSTADSRHSFHPPPIYDLNQVSGTPNKSGDAATTALTFSSASAFTLQANQKGWGGTLYYSTDLETWTEWDGSQISSANGKLYLRGSGNTKITGSNYSGEYRWILSGSDIACTGNIENLLNYETVAKGKHPTMASYCYSCMFDECTSLTAAPELPATTLADYCYYGMFRGCTSLTTAPALPATTLASDCYSCMFYGCTSLTTAPALPATTLASDCYSSMFNGCTNLNTAPTLPATTLAEYCYSHMFRDCIRLTTPPALPATTLAYYCYGSMFSRCTNLNTAPTLPATTLASSCYGSMFSRCTKLTTAPELPATTLASSCYSCMFDGCTNLTTAPELPATTLASSCYSCMFDGCTNLNTAPTLPATTLAEYCYSHMFRDCIRLTTPPALPATTLARSCYYNMFNGCAKLRVSATQTDEYSIPWKIPSAGSISEEPKDWNISMLSNTGGTFRSNPSINTTYYLKQPADPIETTPPTNATADNVLTFSSTSDFTLQATKAWDGTLYYSTNMTAWTQWDGSVIESKGGKLYLCGVDNLVITTGNSWTLTGSDGIACTGNIENLLDYETVAKGEHPTMARSCYSSMFYGCTSLNTAPALPATALTDYCYSSMFYGCTSLNTAPELPATTLASSCYYSMFAGCTSLTTAPALPATALTDYCYSWMFYGCTSLTTAPALPATTLAIGCYRGMFYGCTSLNTAPTLPATTLASYCYEDMFNGCTSLKISQKKTDEYAKPWRIPSVGSISEEATYWNWNTEMLIGTGGTFTGNPSINTTYYLYGTETGIATAEAQPAALRLYPNPASSYVSVSGLPAGGGTVQIFDVAGRLVLSVESNGEETRTIDISCLAPGLHYVRSGSQTAKLMVK